MPAHSIEATLAQIAQAGGRYELTLDAPQGDGWFCPADLRDLDSPIYAGLAEQVQAREDGVTRRYSGLLIYSRCAWMLAYLGLTSFLAARRVPELDLSALRFHWHENGWIDKIALGAPRFYALADDLDAAHDDAVILDSIDALRVRFGEQFEAAVASLTAAFKAQSGMGPAALWAAASDACSYTVISTLQALKREDCCDAEVDAIIQRDGSRLNRRAGVLWIEQGEQRAPVFKRVGCCLWYTLPGNEAHYCSSCPLRPLDERIDMAREYMAKTG